MARSVRNELPLMVAISLLVTFAFGLTAMATVRATPLAPLMASITLGPVWVAAVSLAGDILDGRSVGPRDLAGAVTRHARTGIAVASAPAVVATLLLGSLTILDANPAQRWLLLPIVLDATALLVLALSCFTVFPLVLVSGRRGRDRWLTALALAGRDLTTTLGLAALLVLLALSVRLLGPTPALILAGPLALLSTATTRRTIARAARQDAVHEGAAREDAI